MITTILFDLDGTLLNTLDDLADSTNHVLCLNGYQTHSLSDIRSYVGNGIGLLIRRALPKNVSEAEFEQCLKQFTVYYEDHMQDKTAPYDGVIELLKTLKQMDMKIGVVSNKLDVAVKELCKFYFGELISVAVGESENIRKKPAPDTVLEAMNRLSSNCENTLFVGDSEVDIQTAKNAGIRCISVTWGFRTKEFLAENGALEFIDCPKSLLEIIN